MELGAMRRQSIQVWVGALLIFAVFLQDLPRVDGNAEGDALHRFRQALIDPASILQSWDPTLVNPCTWFFVTCNSQNRIIRVDLGNADLSGNLVPELGELTQLEYLELYKNNISGRIPTELGNLANLVSLDLYQNQLTGNIPEELGKLSNLRFLRLNNNSLQGDIPMSLTNIEDLKYLDLSNNNLTGEVPTNGSFSEFTPISFAGNPDLCGAIVHKQCPGGPPLPSVTPTPTPPQNANQSPSAQARAILVGVAAGMAVLSAAPAIGFLCWWRRRRSIQEALPLLSNRSFSVDSQKMEKVVSVVSGRGLAERWRKWHKVEVGGNTEVELGSPQRQSK